MADPIFDDEVAPGLYKWAECPQHIQGVFVGVGTVFDHQGFILRADDRRDLVVRGTRVALNKGNSRMFANLLETFGVTHTQPNPAAFSDQTAQMCRRQGGTAAIITDFYNNVRLEPIK